METSTDVVAVVGAGAPGTHVLRALLAVPQIEVRYVCDADADAPGLALARVHGVCCGTSSCLDQLLADGEVQLILDTTGDAEVRRTLQARKHPESCLLPTAGVRVIASLAEALARPPVDKAHYVRQASHQLKSPLASIQSYANVLLGGYAGDMPQKVRQVVERIHGRCEAALGALAKCRALADLRSVGRDGLQVGTVRLGDLIAAAAALHVEVAARRGVTVVCSAPVGPDTVRCDPRMTTALLSELIENAVVYTLEQGAVEIAVAPHDDATVDVRVHDNGIGIPEHCLPHIFDEDFRADSAKKQHPDGAGLGLTIAREIADLHGFCLTVRSEEGVGSTFTVTLPSTLPT